MIRFLNKRKRENRQSLIIDNFNINTHTTQHQRHNSFSSVSSIVPSPLSEKEFEFNHNKETEILKESASFNMDNTKVPNQYDCTIYSFDSNDDITYNKQTLNPVYNVQTMHQPQSISVQHIQEHVCNLCHNKNKIKDNFMILTCGHIFHIRCLVDNHYIDANKYGVIDEDYLTSRQCLVCHKQMEMEDILYIHNKFYKNTKEYITKQDEIIEHLDKQMTKLKEELRVCYEYKQKLERQREKSRQITVTINTII